MKPYFTKTLSQAQLEAIGELTAACRLTDQTSLSCPEDGDGYWLLTESKSGRLLACMAVYEMDETSFECCAFTHPDFRNRGYFSRILECACEKGQLPGDNDIYFSTDRRCEAAVRTLEQLDAQLAYEEHMMVYALESTASDAAFPEVSPQAVSVRLEGTSGASLWYSAFSRSVPAGTCQLEFQGSQVYLHHLEIVPSLRSQGLGTAFLQELFPHLSKKGCRTVSLQVSGENTAAMALYKKTGFHITETLSFYLY